VFRIDSTWRTVGLVLGLIALAAGLTWMALTSPTAVLLTSGTVRWVFGGGPW